MLVHEIRWGSTESYLGSISPLAPIWRLPIRGNWERGKRVYEWEGEGGKGNGHARHGLLIDIYVHPIHWANLGIVVVSSISLVPLRVHTVDSRRLHLPLRRFILEAVNIDGRDSPYRSIRYALYPTRNYRRKKWGRSHILDDRWFWLVPLRLLSDVLYFLCFVDLESGLAFSLSWILISQYDRPQNDNGDEEGEEEEEESKRCKSASFTFTFISILLLLSVFFFNYKW